MTSVGYGDNGPKNVLERVACTWLLGRSFKNAYIGVHIGISYIGIIGVVNRGNGKEKGSHYLGSSV